MNRYLLQLIILLLVTGCTKAHNDNTTCLQITHRDGLEETISNTSELSKYKNTNFEQPQNFQKVVQYRRQKEQRVSSIMTYHKNATLQALLETKNGRANGRFLQFHENGLPFIRAYVIEGKADLSDEAKKSFVFHGPVTVYDNKQNCISQMHYEHGKLEGDALEYWSNGALKCKKSYKQGKVDGTVKYFDQNKELIGQTNYAEGLKSGKSFKKNYFEESYEHGRLVQGVYFDQDGKKCYEVTDAIGFKPIFKNNQIQEVHEIQDGRKNGLVKVYSAKGNLINEYTMIDLKKQGNERCYYDQAKKQIQLEIPWLEDQIQGMVKSYYANGKLEAQTEMTKNKKSGLNICYYENASIMMMEEYVKDKLMSGKYYRLDEKTCVSSVENGDGLATIFTSKGEFLRTIEYKSYKMVISDEDA